jgi:hypothetical protein
MADALRPLGSFTDPALAAFFRAVSTVLAILARVARVGSGAGGSRRA